MAGDFRQLLPQFGVRGGSYQTALTKESVIGLLNCSFPWPRPLLCMPQNHMPRAMTPDESDTEKSILNLGKRTSLAVTFAG